MLSEDTLSSLYSFDKEALDAYYKSQFEPMEFEWLYGIRQWIRDTYRVNVMTITYKPWWRNTHLFTVYLRSKDEKIPMVSYSDNKYEHHTPDIEEQIAKHFTVKKNEIIRCRICGPHNTFEGRAKYYLCGKKAYGFIKEIEALFDHLSP